MAWLRIMGLAAALAAPVPAPAQVGPVLGITATEPARGGFRAVLEALDEVAIDVIAISLFWDEFDRGGTYAPHNDWPVIANTAYPPEEVSLALTIPVIDTGVDRRPEDLRDLRWNDPLVLTRFTGFIDRVLDRMPDVEIVTLAIGSEVDGLLRSGDDWADFAAFFAAARAHIRTTRPDLPIGSTMTWDGLRNDPEARRIADLGDGWFVTWYPLGPGYQALPAETFAPTLERMRGLAGDRPLYLTGAGYPSAGCGGSAAAQEALVRIIAGADGIELAVLDRLHDLPPGAAADYAAYYGSGDACFVGFLASLGLRSYTGFDKPAFGALRSR